MSVPADQLAPRERSRSADVRGWIARHAAALSALVIVAPLVWPKLRFAAGTRDFSTDGGHYADVALHFADGDGFVTSLSVLHQGYTYFPHPSSIYPAWPVLMGAVIKVSSLRFAAVWLPTLLYFAVLLLAVRAGRKLWPLRFPRPLAFLDGGHALLLCFVAAQQLFNFTSRPYTEGLSFAVALLFLTRAVWLLSALTTRAAIELGLWLALLLYCRSHFIVFVLALIAAGAVEAVLRVRQRERGLGALTRTLVLALATTVLAFLPFHLFMASFLPDAGIGLYFRFDRARETDFLSQIIRMDGMGPIELLLDRGRGTLLAFDPTWSHAYYRSFGALAYTLPLALLVALVAPRETRARVAALLGEREPRLFRLYLLALAAGALASIHSVHKDFSYEWYFSSRHAVICVFAFYLAAVFALGSRRRWATWLASLLLLAGAAGAVRAALDRADSPTRSGPEAKPIVAWIKAQPSDVPLVLAGESIHLRRVTWRLPADVRRRIGVHTLYARSTLDDLRALTGKLGVQYVISPEDAKRTRVLKESGEYRVADTIDVPHAPRMLVFAPVHPKTAP